MCFEDPTRPSSPHTCPHQRTTAAAASCSVARTARKKLAAHARSFVDGGGNPDTFTADVFRASLAANQAAKGKVLAVGCG